MPVSTFPPLVSPQLDGEGLRTGSYGSLPSFSPALTCSPAPRSPSVMGPPPWSCPGRTLVAPCCPSRHPACHPVLWIPLRASLCPLPRPSYF